MQDGDDLNEITADPIGYDIGCARDDEFACAGHATRVGRAPEIPPCF
jgi:hypothetical protein